MLKSGSNSGTTLRTNISGCLGLSLYTENILIINTKNEVYLFNLTNNQTTCILGCDDPKFHHIHNALIDNNGNLIITDSNQIISFPLYHQCSEG